MGEQAPSLGVKTWFNLPPGKDSVDIGDYNGKVMKERTTSSNNHRGFLLVLILGLSAGHALQITGRLSSRPDIEQQIAATLVSWGHSLDGMRLPVETAEVDARVAQLRSTVSEERVQAADWLASRGVRSSGIYIAAAMNDSGTFRPCQLAKSLGSLGDDRWTGDLIEATQQRSNTDLQVCATLALGELQSRQAISALMEVYGNGPAATFALKAMGRIADPASHEFLQHVMASPRNEIERIIAADAIEHIQLLQQPDPVAALIGRLQQQVSAGRFDRWSVRRLATFGDDRATPALGEALAGVGNRDERVCIAAALLAHGKEGRRMLRQWSAATLPARVSGSVTAVAQAALNLQLPQ